jgi:hypothetical protein
MVSQLGGAAVESVVAFTVLLVVDSTLYVYVP